MSHPPYRDFPKMRFPFKVSQRGYIHVRSISEEEEKNPIFLETVKEHNTKVRKSDTTLPLEEE